jgi:hypothetical protein
MGEPISRDENVLRYSHNPAAVLTVTDKANCYQLFMLVTYCKALTMNSSVRLGTEVLLSVQWRRG